MVGSVVQGEWIIVIVLIRICCCLWLLAIVLHYCYIATLPAIKPTSKWHKNNYDYIIVYAVSHSEMTIQVNSKTMKYNVTMKWNINCFVET